MNPHPSTCTRPAGVATFSGAAAEHLPRPNPLHTATQHQLKPTCADIRQVSEHLLEQQLSTSLARRLAGGDPDLLIRTSGEQRLSNFLLWECAYSELHFTDTCWPDFDRAEWERALRYYASRQRRYGRRGTAAAGGREEEQGGREGQGEEEREGRGGSGSGEGRESGSGRQGGHGSEGGSGSGRQGGVVSGDGGEGPVLGLKGGHGMQGGEGAAAGGEGVGVGCGAGAASGRGIGVGRGGSSLRRGGPL